MSQCATMKKFFSSYIEQTIEPESKRRLEQHLESCVKCTKVLSGMKALSVRFNKLKPLHTSDSFDRRLRDRIIENRPIAGDKNHIRTFSYGLSAAAILVVVYFFIFTGPSIPNQNQTTPVSPAIQSAEIEAGNPVKQSVNQEPKMASTINDSSESKLLSDEEKRALNLVDQ